ncbi:MAG TPA: GntR family transcriptional regulator [Clostridia bacterium]|nr:GntR family transcriptional regulator [Clostridia bacterium]
MDPTVPEIRVRRKSGIPLYVQLTHQIEQLVYSGRWPRGEKLPTERELASLLGISRNTVSMAYRELEAKGILSSRQGRGTFVSGPQGESAGGLDRERLISTLEMCLDEAILSGLSIEEFMAITEMVAERKKEALCHLQVVFVECNREQLDYFSKELELGAGIRIVPMLLEDINRREPRTLQILSEADLVVTTFFHLDEVKDMLTGIRSDILGIALDPLLETMVKIARIDPGKKVGLVCISRAFADRVKKSLTQSGIELEFSFTTTREKENLRSFLKGLDVVITSPGRRKEVEELKDPGAEVIEFTYRPDAGSINLLKSALLERRSKGPGEVYRRLASKSQSGGRWVSVAGLPKRNGNGD